MTESHDGPVADPPVEETQYVPDDDGAARAPAAASTARTFGRFRVLSLIGTGATGCVYRAHDDVLNRAIAIKAMHPGCDATVRTRFLNEARVVGSVLHPHILAVFDAGTEGDNPYLVMELATGSLRDAMRARRLDVESVRRVGVQIARALAAAHAANILHRDVKPANILATDGETWKLADFGIARLPDSTLTDTGQFLGSPSYAAPESIRAAQFTPASDLYALAATLYEALAGAPPHGTHDLPSVVRKLEQDPPPLHFRCAVPREMADAIMAALSRDPAARPTADDFAARLAPAEVEVARAAPAPSAAPVPVAARRYARTAIAAAVLAACLLAAAVVVRVREPSPETPVFSSSRVDRPPTAAPSTPPAAKPVDPPPAAPDPSPPASDPSGPVDPYASNGTGQPSPPDEPAPPDPWTDEARIAPNDHIDDDTARALLRDLERDAHREVDGFRRPHGRRWRWR